MKVLLLNGSPNTHGCTYTALTEITKEFDKAGIRHEIVQIGEKGHPWMHRLLHLPQNRVRSLYI